MGKLSFLLYIIICLEMPFVIMVDHIPGISKVVMVTIMLWIPMYPIIYFHAKWLEKLMKREWSKDG